MLQSSGLVRIDSPPVLIYICMLHAHSASCLPESSCCIEVIIVFRPALPRTALSWFSTEVLANHNPDLYFSAQSKNWSHGPITETLCQPYQILIRQRHIFKGLDDNLGIEHSHVSEPFSVDSVTNGLPNMGR